jgi:hypothetical protein
MLRKPATGRKPAAEGDRRNKNPGCRLAPGQKLSFLRFAIRGDLEKSPFVRLSSAGHFRAK